MLGGSVKSWSVVALMAALGACSNIIGLSEIDIDPSLDPSSGGEPGSGGKSTTGGKSTAGDTVIPEGGVPGDGGKASGGSAGKTSDAGASAGGEPPSGCQRAAECDDDIDCTVDTCEEDGKCAHKADSTLCTAGTDMCTSCKVGIGCVDSAPVVKELLLDGNFDDATGDWVEYSEDYDDQNIFADAAAHSGGFSVKLGPAKAGEKDQEFSDLNQLFTVPASTVKLTLAGYFKLAPGTKLPTEDYAQLTLFSPDTDSQGNYTRYVDYHSFDGNDPKQEEWAAFSYETSKSVIKKVAGKDVTLDLVCETWETVYYFDSLSLKASVCE
jgi:hypothetical protein